MSHCTPEKRSLRLGTVALVCAFVAVVAAGVIWGRRTTSNPAVVFLVPERDAVWLRPDRPFNGGPQAGPVDVRTEYRSVFPCERPIVGAVLRYRALRTAEVRLDGRMLASFAPRAEWDQWRNVRAVPLPRLPKGEHCLEITVLDHNGPALLQAWCDALGLATAVDWEARLPEGDWKPARSVHEPWVLSTARQAPSVPEALRSREFVFAAIFLIWLAAIWTADRRLRSHEVEPEFPVSAARFRWFLIGLWGLLALNNECKLPFFGFDSKAHSDYIQYLLAHHRIPLANEGWQMFQAPLYHLLGALVYGPLSVIRESYGWHAVRLLTMVCGILQVEICYRAVRRVFPNRDGLQIVGTLVGGLMPMNVYMSQSLGNEPLAGLLSSATLVIGLGMLDGEYAKQPKWWVLLGVTWGAAMLTKVTPLLLSVPLLVMCFRGMLKEHAHAARIALAAGCVLGSAFVVCGWYYVRNAILLGHPFVGGWDAGRGIEWWQDPGYRVAEHFLRFGEALKHPIYAAHAGLWDGLYSTMWLDGYLLATQWEDRPPWNVPLLISTAAFGLIPLALMLLGGLRAVLTTQRRLRWMLTVCLLAIGIYLAAVASLYLKVPVYSVAKGTYLLGLLPCFAILAAAGCEVVRPSRIAWRVLLAALALWATCVYAAYFIV